MAGFGFGNVGFVGALAYAGGGVVTPPPGPDRALQFIAASTGYASLTTPDTALTSATWAIRDRVRADAANGGGYVSSRASGSLDKAAFVYNFLANTFAFFDNNNSTGGSVYLPLTIATPPSAAYHLVEFIKDEVGLRAFLNGSPAGSLAVAFTLNASVADLILGQRNATGGGESNVTIASVREDEASVPTVTLELNEAAPGPYLNTGSDGGQLMVFPPAPISVLV